MKIKNYPLKIYVEGNYNILNNNSIAMVGSRKCTMYGWEQAIKFSKELSANGICIVSGMAIGIDKASHIGAKSDCGKTIAVLAGGFEDIYPEENKPLFYEIIENGGCIVTEYSPKEKTKSTNFPKRNRIISGIAQATLIVEAELRSGSLITARHTIQQKKPLFCIPSNLDNSKGVGTNKLIKEGATLVTGVDDILDKLNIEKKTKNIVNDKNIKSGIKKEYRKIYNSLANIPMTVDEISWKSKKDISEVNNILTMLELEGYVKYHQGNRYSLIEK